VPELDPSFIGLVRLPETYHLDHFTFTQQKYDTSHLPELEEIENICDIYLWLSHHFKESFVETEMCLMIKERCDEIIEAILSRNGQMYNYRG
jgi:hypothetical protein